MEKAHDTEIAVIQFPKEDVMALVPAEVRLARDVGRNRQLLREATPDKAVFAEALQMCMKSTDVGPPAPRPMCPGCRARFCLARRRRGDRSDNRPQLAALVAADDILGGNGDELAVIRAHGRSQFPLKGVPCFIAGSQVTADQRADVFARVLIETFIPDLLLDVILQRAADLHMNAA